MLRRQPFRYLCCGGPEMITSGKPGILFSSEYARVSASSADLTLFSATKTGTPSCKSQRPRCGSLPMMREAVDQIVSTDLVVTAVHYKISDIEGFLCGCVSQQCSLECTKALWASSTPRFPASSRSATLPGHPGFLPNTHWDGLYPLTRPMLFLVLRVSCKQILKSLSSVASESATTRLSIAFITPWALSTFPMAVGVSEDNFKAVRGQKPLYHASVMYPPVTGDLFWPTGPANPTVNHGVGTALGCWHSTSNLDNFSQVETSGDIHKAEYGIRVCQRCLWLQQHPSLRKH